jgi:hypothetical protein
MYSAESKPNKQKQGTEEKNLTKAFGPQISWAQRTFIPAVSNASSKLQLLHRVTSTRAHFLWRVDHTLVPSSAATGLAGPQSLGHDSDNLQSAGKGAEHRQSGDEQRDYEVPVVPHGLQKGSRSVWVGAQVGRGQASLLLPFQLLPSLLPRQRSAAGGAALSAHARTTQIATQSPRVATHLVGRAPKPVVLLLEAGLHLRRQLGPLDLQKTRPATRHC